MDPVSISAFLVANAGTISAVAGGLGAVGSIMQGNQQAAAYNQQAEASERNADIAQNQARQAYDAGLQNELGQRRSASQQQADIRASVAESGLDPSSGSALMFQQQSAENLEMDALTTRYQALLQGNSYEQQAAMDRYQAKALRASARDARASGRLGAATSILTSAAGYGLAKLAPAAAAGSGVRAGGGLGLRVGNVAQYWR
jgi:murein L,D-transpeptidase YcbB/YkuD